MQRSIVSSSTSHILNIVIDYPHDVTNMYLSTNDEVEVDIERYSGELPISEWSFHFVLTNNDSDYISFHLDSKSVGKG